MDYDLGFFDNEVNRVEPVGEIRSPQKCYPCLRDGPVSLGSDGWNRTTDLGVMNPTL